MELLTSLLSDPKLWSVLSLPTIIIMVLLYVVYWQNKKINDLQEQRLDEWKAMNKDYMDLCNSINKTLDLLIQLSGNKRNGNGGTN